MEIGLQGMIQSPSQNQHSHSHDHDHDHSQIEMEMEADLMMIGQMVLEIASDRETNPIVWIERNDRNDFLLSLFLIIDTLPSSHPIAIPYDHLDTLLTSNSSSTRSSIPLPALPVPFLSLPPPPTCFSRLPSSLPSFTYSIIIIYQSYFHHNTDNRRNTHARDGSLCEGDNRIDM